MSLLTETLARIQPPDQACEEQARQRLDRLSKPPGSLGILEEIAWRLAGIQRLPLPKLPRDKVSLVLAGDHGVVIEGVSAFPQAVTPQMILNFLNGGAGINVLARQAGARVVVVDVGVAGPPLDWSGLISCRIRSGTDNFASGPAMSRDEARRSIEAGITILRQQVKERPALVGIGEVGIGNTTASAAILAAFTGVAPELITGRGTGIDDRQLQHKIAVIKRGLAINQPDAHDGLDVLAKVGGLEIGAMAGVILGCAAAGIPVVLDGFISGAAAMLAISLAPLSRKFMFASHVSEEPGHRYLMQRLDLKPILQMEMRLGEGTGAAIVFPIIESAVHIINDMATFAEAGVSEE